MCVFFAFVRISNHSGSMSMVDGVAVASSTKICPLQRAGTIDSSGGQALISSCISSWADKYLGHSRIPWMGSAVAPGQIFFDNPIKMAAEFAMAGEDLCPHEVRFGKW
jgi:hypothetical protein